MVIQAYLRIIKISNKQPNFTPMGTRKRRTRKTQSQQERNKEQIQIKQDFPGGSEDKVSVYNVGDPGSIPGLGRYPGEGNGNPLQYYCLENPMGRGAWQAAVHGITNSQTRLSNFTFTFRSYLRYEVNETQFLNLSQPQILNSSNAVLWRRHGRVRPGPSILCFQGHSWNSLHDSISPDWVVCLFVCLF